MFLGMQQASSSRCLWLAGLLLAMAMPVRAETTLRVMTLNIWKSGQMVDNALEKIAKHIRIVNPDIVALQEVYTNVTWNLTDLLGPPWEGFENSNFTYPDTAILTKHTVVPNTTVETNCSVGGRIQLDSGETIMVWNVHLDALSYGPYAAFNKLVTSMHQIMAGENIRRASEVKTILAHPAMRKAIGQSAEIPVVVVGDHNSPSHLDWIDGNRDIHGGWAVEWPSTKLLEGADFNDSYRVLHPDVFTHPGLTWSSVQEFADGWDYTIPEPKDRIDFIHYMGPLKPIASTLYSGREPLKRIPYQKDNDFPSDHLALYTDFCIPNYR